MMLHRQTFIVLLHARTVFLLCFLVLGGTMANAQTIDYDLNQATRALKDVESGLGRLQFGDVNNYNRLGQKLNKAAGHLEKTESKTHPDFEAAVKRWGELQAQMAAIGQQWNAAVQQQQAEAAAQAAAASAPAPTTPAPGAPAANKPATTSPAASAPAAPAKPAATVEAVNLDPLMEKYQRENLPQLPDAATAQQARQWAEQIRALQTDTLQADLATIDEALASGAASKNDADRVRYWISDSFQGNISRTVYEKVQASKGLVRSLEYMADMINDVEDGDANGAYRFAGGDKYAHNVVRLDDSLRAGAVSKVFEEVFGEADPERAARVEKIRAARARLDELKPAADKQFEVLASAKRQQPARKKDFLAPVAQKFWLNGSVMAETDKEGGIWIDGNNVGDITHNGEIWVEANERGSIEPNGEVWFNGNEVGSLEKNGEVWRDGNQVGLIDKDGKVWVNGSASGEIEPFDGEWRRAAVLYYFRDLWR